MYLQDIKVFTGPVLMAFGVNLQVKIEATYSPLPEQHSYQNG